MARVLFAVRCRSDPCIPFIPAVFPKPALSAPDPVEPIGYLNVHNIFCVLVAELPFDAQPQRGSMVSGQRLAIETVRKNGLRMECVDEIDAFIILSGTVERLFKNVGAVEDNEAGGGKKGRALQHNRHAICRWRSSLRRSHGG